MKKHLSTYVTLGFLALFGLYGYFHQEIFHSLAQVSIFSIVLIVIGKLINIYTTGLFTKWTVEAFTDTLSQSESFVVAVLTAVGNFFGPLFGGLGIRALYLKKYHNLSYSHFTSTLIGYYQMMFQFNNILAMVSLLLLPHNRRGGIVFVFFLLWFIAFLLLALIKLPPKERLGRLPKVRFLGFVIKAMYDIESGWRLLLGKKKLLLQMAGLAIINLVALYATNYVEFRALNIHTTPAAMGLYTAVVQASMLLSITPGAVGIREAILVLLSTTIGITNAQIIQVAILDRGIYFMLLAVLLVATRHSKLRRSLLMDSQAAKA